jgi:class 3 adenylate cyclase/uncharacterized protein (DUF2141 family)
MFPKEIRMIQNLPKYLQSFPWDSELLRKGDSPLDYLWEFDLPEPPEELWSWLIDTSSFNRRIGVPEMFYKEINGKLFGKSVNAGFKMEWEEVPWEWEYCKSLNNARIYSKGLAKFVRTRYLLYPFQNGTKLIVYFGWIPRGILGRILISFGMKKLYLDYKKGLDGIILDLRKKRENSLSTQALFNSIQSNVNSNNYPTKLQQIANELIKNKCNPDLVHRIIEYILNEDENNLYRIRVKQLAMDWNIPLTNLLFIFLHGCRQGLFTLSWDIICPHCRGVRTEAKHLGDLPEMDSCEVCEIDFETNKLNSIEVCFHVHPSIREVQKRFFCAAEPATKQHIYMQKFLSPQETSMTQMDLKSGTYRFRINGDKNFAIGNIAEQEGESKLDWNPSQLTHEFKLKKDASIQLINPTNQKLGFIIESKKEDQNVLRPADLFNLQDFRDLFAEESLAQGLSLDIGLQTILFTDIVGSTKLYSQLGDGKAFEKVRSHFVHAYRIIQEGDGAVIKTIGDAVMASFPSSLKGVSASIHLQKFFNESTNPGILKIRTTLHTGPCLAVNLNTNIDYFGNTVNLAAKLQKVASDKEIVFTEAIFRDKEVRDYLLKNKIKLRKFPFHQDWEGSTIEIYKLPLE